MGGGARLSTHCVRVLCASPSPTHHRRRQLRLTASTRSATLCSAVGYSAPFANWRAEALWAVRASRIEKPTGSTVCAAMYLCAGGVTYFIA